MRIICCDGNKTGIKNREKGDKGPGEQDGWSFASEPDLLIAGS